MKELIDNALIKRLRPAAEPYEVRDTRVTGFLLRVEPGGTRTFFVQYARGKRVKLGHGWPARPALSPTRARQRAEQIRGDVAHGLDPVEARRRAKADTLGSFVSGDYADWARANIRTAEATIARLKSAFGELLNKKLPDLTAWQLEKWRSLRLKGANEARSRKQLPPRPIKASTVNRELDDIKSALNKAVERQLLERNPIASVRRSRSDGMRRPRFLSHDEEARLRQALNNREERIRRQRDSANRWRSDRGYDPLPDLRQRAFVDRLQPLVLLSLHTGMRRGEVFGLTWADVDLVGKQITIGGARAKNGTTRHIPLNRAVLDVLNGWRAGRTADGVVFPGMHQRKLNNVRRSFGGVLKAAKITGFRWHDLRHTFASNLVMAGENLNTVRELLGHSDYKMTLRYAHLAPDHKAAAVERLVKL